MHLDRSKFFNELSNKGCVFLKKGHVIFDFGKEYYGEPHIVTAFIEEFRPIKMHIRYGESLSECSSNIGEHNATNDHALRDFVIDVPSLSNLALPKSGLRFMRIDILDDSRGRRRDTRAGERDGDWTGRREY